MKHGYLTAAVLSMCLCTACTNRSSAVFEPIANHTNPPKPSATAETSCDSVNVEFVQPEAEQVSSEAESGPPMTELQRRIGAIYALEPQPIPEEGWTDETLLPLISIGGEPAEIPFCISALLYGYELTGEHADYYTEHADEVFSHWYTFTGNKCYVHSIFGDIEILPRVETHNPDLPDGADDDELELDVSWCVPAADGSVRYPVSVNCVTIGSTFHELVERIGLSEGDGIYNTEFSDGTVSDWFSVRCTTENVSILFWGSHNVVHTIQLTDRNG